MSAELDMTSGVAAMASTQVEWHNQQNLLGTDEPLEVWAQKAGMTHKLLRAKVRYFVDRSESRDSLLPVDDKMVIFRDDNKKAMGIVSDNYKIVQPKQVLEFFRDLIAKNGFKMQTAGCLFDGRRYWAMAETGDVSYVKDKRDTIKSHLLLSSSCDGSTATEARFTDVRVVCWNTMQMALRVKANSRVTHRSVFSAEAIQGDLGLLATEAFSDRIATLRELAEKPLSFADVVRLTAELIVPGSSQTEEGLNKVAEKKAAREIGDMALNNRIIGAEFAGTKGTAFGWLQAVTQYVDHMARARSEENRRNSAWFGPGSDLKLRALELVTAA